MTIDAATFKARFPEFIKASDALVDAKLGEAQRLCAEAIWGTLHEDGVFYTAAQLIALSPSGRAMRLTSDEGRTVYDEHLARLKKAVSLGYRVI